MELLLLDKDFQICGLIDDFSSLVWNRKYYDCGSFSLETNMQYESQFQKASYLYCKDFNETAILEALNIKNTTKGTEAVHSGRFLESILDNRCINETQYFKKMITEDIIRSLVTTFAINADDRKIPKLRLGERKGLGRERTIQITGDSLLTRIYELCKEDELSIKLWYDFDNDELVFEVWQGIDRKDTQTENSWAIFSKNFENILEDEYSIDNTNNKNFAYVAGELRKYDNEGKETSTRIIETVNRIQEGEERKELYIDARDLQSDEDTTEEEYRQMLIERGIDKLNENKKVETADFSINTNSNLSYKKHYDLGDEVIYKNEELGITVENRIVEVNEAYENGKRKLDITFGSDYNLKKIKEAIK